MNAYLLLSGIPTALASSLLSSAISGMAAQFPDKSSSEVKMLNSAASFTLAVISPLLMAALSRVQRYHKLILIVSCAGYAVLGCLPALFYTSYLAILLLRCGLGLFCGVLEPLSLFHMSQHAAMFGYRATTMSFLSLIFNISGGAIVDAWGWNNLFWIYAAVALLIIPIALADFAAPQTEEYEKLEEGVRAAQPQRCSGWTAFQLFQIFTTAFVSQLAYYIVPSSTSLKLKEIGVTDAVLTGLASGLSMFFNGLLSLFTAFVFRLLRKRVYVSALSGVLTGLAMIGFAFTEDYAWLCVAVSLVGLFQGCQMPNYNAWAASVRKSPVTMGVVSFCTFFSHFMTPIAFCSDDEQTNILAAGISLAVWGTLLFAMSFFRPGGEN